MCILLLLLSTAAVAEPLPDPIVTAPVTTTTPADDAAAKPAHGPLAIHIALDTTISTRDQVKANVARIRAIQALARDDDQIGLSIFSGAVTDIVPMGPAHTVQLEPALNAVSYTETRTFFSPLYMDLATRPAIPGLKSILLILSDGESDPLNEAASRRQVVDDRSWSSPAPSLLSGLPVFWLTPVAKPGAHAPPPTPGALTTSWAVPDADTTVILWNPAAEWHPTGTELTSWLEEMRPILPPPVLALPPEEPAKPWVDWSVVGYWAQVVVGGIVVSVASLGAFGFARRKMKEAAEKRDEDNERRRLKDMMEAAAAKEGTLRLEPLDIQGDVVELTIHANDEVDVAAAARGRNKIALAVGAGFRIQIGDRPDRATILARGTRSALTLRRGSKFIPVGTDDPVALCDGDIVLDRSENALVRIRLIRGASTRRADPLDSLSLSGASS